MAGNIFTQNPLSIALDEGRKRREMTMQERGIGPQAGLAPVPTFDGISSKHQVPVNILMSMTEGLGESDALAFADNAAQRLAPRLQAGESVTDALTAEFGSVVEPDAMTSMLDRARVIGDKLYPVQVAPVLDPDADPFEGEGAGALLARRGQQVAVGVTDVVAAAPEQMAINQASSEISIGEDARGYVNQANEQIRLIEERIAESPDMPDDERANLELVRSEAEATIQSYTPIQTGSEIAENIQPAHERDLHAMGDDLREASTNIFGAPDKRDTSFWGKLAVGGGNMAGFVLVSLLGSVVAGPAGGIVAGGSAGSAMTGSQLYNEAIESGADEATALEASRIGSLIGMTEVIPIAHALRFLPSSVRAKLAKGIVGRFASIVGNAGEEAAQEFLATVAQNLVAQEYYDPDRGWADGAAEAALIGAILGGGMGVPGAVRGDFSNKDESDDNPDGDNPAPDSSEGPGGFTGLRLTPDQRVDAPPTPPSGPLGRAAQSGPAPISTEFDNGQMVNITTSGGMNMNAQFVQETPTGILVTDLEDGSPLEIPREEIERGDTIVTPATAPTVQASAPQAELVTEPDNWRASPASIAAYGRRLGIPEAKVSGTVDQMVAMVEAEQLRLSAVPVEDVPVPEVDAGPVTMQQEILPTNAPNPPTDALMPDMVKAQEQVAAGQPSLGQLAGEGIAQAESQPRPKPEPAVDAPMSVDEARERLAYAKSQARSNGWSKGLVEIKRAAETVIAADEQSAVGVVEDAMAEGETPAPAETRRDGSPFSSGGTALRALSNRQLKPEDFDIVPRDGGFVAVARAATPALDASPQVSVRQPAPVVGSQTAATARPTPQVETKRDGTPFASEAAARQALKNRRLDQNAYEIEAKDSGFLAVKRAANSSVSVQDDIAQDTEAKGDKTPIEVTPSKAKVSDTEGGQKSETPPVSDVTEPTTTKEVEEAASEADTAPTDAQKEAGNYKLGHIDIHGLDVSIENAKGSERSGKDADGESWSVTMPAHYGYIKRTEGADGDHVDVYIGDNPESDVVVVIDQLDLATGNFDEHKIILGAKDADTAYAIYEGGFSDGKGADRMGASTEMTVDGFKAWLETGDQSKPLVDEVGTVDKKPEISDLVAEPASQPKADFKANSANPLTNSGVNAEKIEDFGEVLQGAAKHYAEAYEQKLWEATGLTTAEQPLSKTWPAPDYQKLIDEGADPWTVAFARAARDEIPSKPRGRYAKGRLANWSKQVNTLRGFAADVLAGEMSKDKVKHGLLVGGRGLEGVGNRVDLYVAVGHDKSLAGVTLNEGHYGIYDGVEHNPPMVMWTVSRAAKATAFGNMPYNLAKGATKEEAIAPSKRTSPPLKPSRNPTSRSGLPFIHIATARATLLVKRLAGSMLIWRHSTPRKKRGNFWLKTRLILSKSWRRSKPFRASGKKATPRGSARTTGAGLMPQLICSRKHLVFVACNSATMLRTKNAKLILTAHMMPSWIWQACWIFRPRPFL